MSDVKQTVGDPTNENDIQVLNNTISFVTGGDEILQRVRQRLNTFLAEWFLDLSVGVPYFEQVLIKNPNADVIQAIFKREILGTPGIVELLEYTQDLDVATRNLKITFTARGDEGVLSDEILVEAA